MEPSGKEKKRQVVQIAKDKALALLGIANVATSVVYDVVMAVVCLVVFGTVAFTLGPILLPILLHVSPIPTLLLLSLAALIVWGVVKFIRFCARTKNDG